MASGEGAPGPAEDGGWFGSWAVDADGLACFDLDLAPWRRAWRALVVPEGGPEECWHQVASPDITAMAHVGGWTTLWEGRRGMVALSGPRSWWGDPGDPIGSPGRRADAVRWGRGYAEWRAHSGGWSVVRRVSAPLGAGTVLRIDVELLARQQLPDGPRPGTGASAGPPPGPARYAEAWVPEAIPLLIGALMSPAVEPPPGSTPLEAIAWRAMYGASAAMRAMTRLARAALARSLQHRPVFLPGRRAVLTPARWPRTAGDPTSPAHVDLRLPHVAVALASATIEDSAHGSTGDLDKLVVSADGPALVIDLPEDTRSARLSLVVALVDREVDLPRAVETALAVDRAEASKRQRELLRLDLTEHPGLAREAGWHATHLVGEEQYDDAFAARYPSQGSAYGFVHGVQGAPRDYAISSVPLSMIDPPAAADALRVIMQMTSADGTIHYAHTGRGRVTSGGIHTAPSDLSLFFLWALVEYIDATADRGFLPEEVPYLPVGSRPAARASVIDRSVQALTHVAERVGTGPHGLLRVGSGDWSDPISAMVPDRAAFHTWGESGFNTTMACHVLPRAADLVEPVAPQAAADARSLAWRLRDAMEASWAGEWYLRGWDGRGGPVGDRHLFLDGQVWALIARIGTEAQRTTLIEAIRQRCMDPSPIGATILDRAHPVRFGMLAPGWDCNGGVWAALNGLLAWGLAGHDLPLAWRSLREQSLAAHARAYPWVWFGIWSGPDAYNAHFGSRPGETFIQPATPMQEHPVMNSNAHAGPLLGLLKVLAEDRGRGEPASIRRARA